MGNYAYELKEATTFINKEDFNKVLEDIKREVRKEEWRCYGWRNNVLNAKTLEDVIVNEFRIKLFDEGDGYYKPIINGINIS